MGIAEPALNALHTRRTKLERWGRSEGREFVRREVRRVRWVGFDSRNGRVLVVFGYWHVVSIANDAWTTKTGTERSIRMLNEVREIGVNRGG